MRIELKASSCAGIVIAFSACSRCVDKVKDDLTDVHGSLHYNLKDEFPQFCKEALSFVPEAYWWAFSLAILFGFVLALYRRMT